MHRLHAYIAWRGGRSVDGRAERCYANPRRGRGAGTFQHITVRDGKRPKPNCFFVWACGRVKKVHFRGLEPLEMHNFLMVVRCRSCMGRGFVLHLQASIVGSADGMSPVDRLMRLIVGLLSIWRTGQVSAEIH